MVVLSKVSGCRWDKGPVFSDTVFYRSRRDKGAVFEEQYGFGVTVLVGATVLNCLGHFNFVVKFCQLSFAPHILMLIFCIQFLLFL